MEDNRNQSQMDRSQSMQDQDQNMNNSQSGQQQNMNNAEENSQDGGQWNNYRTREMSGNIKDAESDNSTMGNP